ncbi:ABC-type bacteriocin/lantibiotic exporter, contains an N-terminal double-glycine peptidase domain [Candidatus Burkholderia humilis]|nr:ABC-type bacteriocin/lantibiotic exporter, contains an N-terminal double-glycine peptidase domain [Candidatus Burkholderia humilis]
MTAIVRIDDEVVDVGEFIRLLKLSGQFDGLIEQMVRDKITVKAAKKAGVRLSDDEIQTRADQFRRIRGLHRAADMNNYLDALNVSLDEFEVFITDTLYQEKMLDQVGTQREVEEYFQLNSPKFDSIEVSHIVLDTEGSAKEMISYLNDDPDSFADMARKHSLADTRDEGGVIGRVMRGQMKPEIEASVQCTFESLRGFDMPLIAHWEGYHYIIVYGVSKENVWVADPAVGFKKMTVGEFERGWSGTCLLFTPAQDMTQQDVSRSPWIRFVGYLKPYKKILLHLFLATFVIQVLGVIPPLIIQNILDGVIVHQNVGLLHVLIGGLIIASVFTQLMSTIRAYLANFMVRNMDFAMMSQFFKHTFSLPFSFFAKKL